MVWPFPAQPNKEAQAADQAVGGIMGLPVIGPLINMVTWLPRKALGAVGSGLDGAGNWGLPGAIAGLMAGAVSLVAANKNGEDVNPLYRLAGSAVAGTVVGAGIGAVAGTASGVVQPVMNLAQGAGNTVGRFTTQAANVIAPPANTPAAPAAAPQAQVG